MLVLPTEQKRNRGYSLKHVPQLKLDQYLKCAIDKIESFTQRLQEKTRFS